MAEAVVHEGVYPEIEGRRYFRCPGCGDTHFVTDGWTWNGDFVKPTFTPSVLVEGHRFKFKHSESDVSESFRCHSVITDGRIAYLWDCTHALAGQTVDLPPWRTP